MPRINSYTDNTTIENDDKMLTYDTQGAATKLTSFSTIWNWIVSKLHALTSSSAALTPSTDRVVMDKNGTMTRVEPAVVAKYGIETYNGSTIAGQAQTVKSALDSLNSNSTIIYTGTTSFAEIDPVRQDAQGLGAWIDAKISSVISSFEKFIVHMVSGVNNGPYYGAIFFKASDSYYAGILWSYHQNARKTLWYFEFSNGTYKLRPLAVPIL